jgi:hypothetical protein
MEIYNFRRAPVVSVPIAEVANTIASWLCWMAGSYAGPLGTWPPRGWRALILRSCNTWV